MRPVLMAVGCRSIPSTLYDAVRYRDGLWRSLAAHLLWEQGVALRTVRYTRLAGLVTASLPP